MWKVSHNFPLLCVLYKSRLVKACDVIETCLGPSSKGLTPIKLRDFFFKGSKYQENIKKVLEKIQMLKWSQIVVKTHKWSC